MIDKDREKAQEIHVALVGEGQHADMLGYFRGQLMDGADGTTCGGCITLASALADAREEALWNAIRAVCEDCATDHVERRLQMTFRADGAWHDRRSPVSKPGPANPIRALLASETEEGKV